MPDARIVTAVGQLKALNGEFAQAMLGPIDSTGVVDNLLARYGAYGYRQLEAVTVLSEVSDGLHLQVSQLVRSLVEAWFYAAWLVAPANEMQRTQRAIGLVIKSLRAHRDKVVYQEGHWPNTDPDHLVILEHREQEAQEKAENNGHEFPPDLRQGMEGLGRADRYILYRWDSDAVHVSTTGIGQLAQEDGEFTLLGVHGEPPQQLSRLVAAWAAAADLYEIVFDNFGLLVPEWATKRDEAEATLTHLFEAE
jgi:hypothetical protein